MVEKLVVELADCTNVLLREIEDKNFIQKDIAMTYCLAMMSSEKVDYEKVNNAIIERWSYSGLQRVKDMAWKLMEQKKEGI